MPYDEISRATRFGQTIFLRLDFDTSFVRFFFSPTKITSIDAYKTVNVIKGIGEYSVCMQSSSIVGDSFSFFFLHVNNWITR